MDPTHQGGFQTTTEASSVAKSMSGAYAEVTFPKASRGKSAMCALSYVKIFIGFALFVLLPNGQKLCQISNCRQGPNWPSWQFLHEIYKMA